MIAQQSGQNCVARALSTMRLALGYNSAVPKELQSFVGGKVQYEILESVKKWFPDHEVKVYCGDKVPQHASDDSAYCGSQFDMTEKEIDEYIIAFSYYTTSVEWSHFVVGAPTLYEHMNTSIIVCVKQC